jgi:chromatin remodeling complex protein RSC6
MVKKKKQYNDSFTLVVDSEKADIIEDNIISSEEVKKNQKPEDINEINDMITNFDNMCDNILIKITEDYKSQKEEIRKLKLKYHQDIKKAKKVKTQVKVKKATGFTKTELVPYGLTRIINVAEGTILSRTQVTKKVYGYIKQNNLYYEKNKRVLRADSLLKEVFNLSDYVNKSTNEKDKNGFNFYNIQKYISKCYNN